MKKLSDIEKIHKAIDMTFSDVYLHFDYAEHCGHHSNKYMAYRQSHRKALRDEIFMALELKE